MIFVGMFDTDFNWHPTSKFCRQLTKHLWPIYVYFFFESHLCCLAEHNQKDRHWVILNLLFDLAPIEQNCSFIKHFQVTSYEHLHDLILLYHSISWGITSDFSSKDLLFKDRIISFGTCRVPLVLSWSLPSRERSIFTLW